MLFGYEDWQNDWWIKRELQGVALVARPFAAR
jgi:hypothetical protein